MYYFSYWFLENGFKMIYGVMMNFIFKMLLLVIEYRGLEWNEKYGNLMGIERINKISVLIYGMFNLVIDVFV